MTDGLAVAVWTDDAAALERSLEPLVLGATRPDDIIIIDGTSGGVADVAAAFGRRHPALRVVRRGPRAAALALARDEARARWLLFIGAGDRILPDALGRALALAREHPDAGVVAARAAILDPAGAVASSRGVPGRAAGFESAAKFRELSLEDPLAHVVPSATLLRREALAFGDLGPLAEPLSAWALGAMHGVACLPEPLVDEWSPPAEWERALVDDPLALLEPLRRGVDGLATRIPDALRLEARIRATLDERARANRDGAREVVAGAARLLASGSLLDRTLARALARAARP